MKPNFALTATVVAAILAVLPTIPARAEVPLNGYFIARAECPALQSIRRQNNPGNVMTKVDRAYRLKAKNKAAASHFLIVVKTARPPERWIRVTCGEHVVPVAGGGGEQYVLAVSWQPAFCEQRPNKPECRSQTADRFDANHFTLHGLWPQPRGKVYCNVDPAQVDLDKERKWLSLDALILAPETRAKLERVMPGSQSGLHRHEWIKHGSCYNNASAETYFSHSLQLMQQLNASVVRDLFAAHVGQHLDQANILAAFDTAFGAGSAAALTITCKPDGDRILIGELKLALKGPLGPAANLGELMRAAPPADGGCPGGGIVDPVGLQ